MRTEEAMLAERCLGWIWMLLLSGRNYCSHRCAISFTGFGLTGISKLASDQDNGSILYALNYCFLLKIMDSL